MKKTFILLLITALSLNLCACGNKKAEEAPSVPAATEEISDENLAELDSALDQISDIEVDKNLFSVEITFPKDFVGEDITQEKIDEGVKENGWKSGTLNEDGSVTYVMTKAQHQELLDTTRDSLNQSLVDLINDGTYPSLTKIEANDDFTEFTVYCKSEDIGLAYMVVLNLYAEGGMYGIVSGDKPDNIHVDFVDEQTGNVFDKADSKNMDE